MLIPIQSLAQKIDLELLYKKLNLRTFYNELNFQQYTHCGTYPFEIFTKKTITHSDSGAILIAETDAVTWSFKIIDDHTIHLTCQWKGLRTHTSRNIHITYDETHCDIRSNENEFIAPPKLCSDTPLDIWPHAPYFPAEYIRMNND